ncbi:MAG: hypothetical protein ACFFAN_13865 [Promethearchaeota archaeon]
MIEDEDDDEEILKKGITFKSALKHFLVILLILGGALIMYLGPSTELWTNFALGIMLICLGSMLMQFQKQPPEPLRQTLTILICSVCGLTKVRHYETGDYIFKKKDKCNECDDFMEIKQIYSVKLKNPTESTKKPKSSKFKPEIKT